MDKLQLLLIYISSVIMAKFTHFEAGLDVLKDLADNGYKLKRDSEVEFQSNDYDDFIPIWNIAKAYYDYCNYQNNKGPVLDSLLMDGELEKLSPWEERKYQSRPTKWYIPRVLCEYERHIDNCMVAEIPENSYGAGEVYSKVYFYMGNNGIEILNVEGPFSCKPLEEQLEIVNAVYAAIQLDAIKKTEEESIKLFQDTFLGDDEIAKEEEEALELERKGLCSIDDDVFTPDELEQMKRDARIKLNKVLEELLEEDVRRKKEEHILTRKKDNK